MASYLLNLPDEQMDSVRSFSAMTGIPMSKLFRQAVMQFFCSGQSPCGVVSSGMVASGCMMIVSMGSR